MKASELDDDEYEDQTIDRVDKEKDGYAIRRKDGWSLYIPDVGIIPKVGDNARFYGKGLGRSVRGVAINDDIVFYRTKEEQNEHEKLIKEEIIKDEKKRFGHNKYLLDFYYSKLPEIFKIRLDNFRKNNQDFRWEYESYEMFCIRQALLIADILKNPDTIISFSKSNWKEKKELVHELDEGHSGNTLAFSERLAWEYLTDPTLILKEHGSLCILVGCKKYGCQYGK